MKIPRWQTPERKAYMKAWYLDNPRDRRAYSKAYHESHREHERAYRMKNKKKLSARKRAYYQANRERILAYCKKYASENRERVSAYHRRHYAANKERIKKNVSSYRKANPEKKIHLENRRRTRKFKNGGSHTLEQRQAKFELLGNECFFCNEKGNLSIDHDIPLSRGGGDGIDNILPACRSCNSKKNNKTASEYIEFLFRENQKS